MRKVPPTPEKLEESRWSSTSIRLRREQHEALRRAALERALAQGGKMDASAIIRELIDKWMKESGK